MIALADQFEGAVGAIVERVSQASAELEACSGALSQTAQTTQQLTMTVTAASEQASANVESVAGATEEMSSSVNEIPGKSTNRAGSRTKRWRRRAKPTAALPSCHKPRPVSVTWWR